MKLDFEAFYIWLFKELNLELSGYKQKQLQRRITTVMNKSGSKDLKEYAQAIKKDNEVKNAFLDYITINVTEFYRNPDVFEEFEELLVTEVAKKFSRLKIWSAACSNGAEAYSVAMILKKHNLLHKSTILGTDLDVKILEKAREGKYSETEVRNVSEDERLKYFTKKNRHYYLSDEIKQLVRFKHHDLILDSYEKGYQVIICRNVTIYFDDQVKDKLYQKFSDALAVGGLFFIGSTETIHNPDQYGLRKVGSFIYEKYK